MKLIFLSGSEIALVYQASMVEAGLEQELASSGKLPTGLQRQLTAESVSVTRTLHAAMWEFDIPDDLMRPIFCTNEDLKGLVAAIHDFQTWIHYVRESGEKREWASPNLDLDDAEHLADRILAAVSSPAEIPHRPKDRVEWWPTRKSAQEARKGLLAGLFTSFDERMKEHAAAVVQEITRLLQNAREMSDTSRADWWQIHVERCATNVMIKKYLLTTLPPTEDPVQGFFAQAIVRELEALLSQATPEAAMNLDSPSATVCRVLACSGVMSYMVAKKQSNLKSEYDLYRRSLQLLGFAPCTSRR